MNYVIPKYFLPNLKIVENKKIFKIKYLNKEKYSIVIFGIILKLKDVQIEKHFNEYKIQLNSNIDQLKIYDNLLRQNIPNYKSMIRDNSISIHHNQTIDRYYNDNKKSFYLNIKYVKKTGFLNIQIISIV